MEQIIITHKNGTTLKLNSKENVSTIKKASQQVELLGVDVVDISVESAKKMSFLLGDKITVVGRDYTLNTPARERKISESHFEYDMQFEGVQYDLLRATYNVNIDTTSNKIQDINGDAITGNIKIFLDVLIANANRVFGTGKWVVGTYPANTKTITLTFNDSDNCLTVLQNLCGEDNFNTEFKIGIDGSGNRTLNIGATGATFGTTFQYGKGKGIYELTREKVSSSNIITRLNCFGSSKNIITPKYRAAKLCLPSKTKTQSFIENTSAIATYGVWEGSKDFDDIYPHRTGVISSLGANVFEFIDSSMNFDLNEKNVDLTTKYLMAGTSAKIHFNNGNLAGYEFEVNKYDAVTKKFTITSQTDQNDYIFPSTTTAAFQFAMGDEYIITDIYMPQAYIDTAEAELAVKGAEYLAKYSQPLVQYGLTIDSNYLKNQVGADALSNIIWVGDYIPIKDLDLEVDKTIRVKGFTRDLLLDYNYQLTIADLSVTVSIINRVVSGMNTVDNIIKINNLNDPAKARRNWKDSQEVLNMIFDPEGDFYTDKIKPLSIETSMLSVGSKSMQFGLEGTIFQPNYAGAKNRVVYAGGTLTHYAIFDANDAIRTWNITDGDVVITSDTARYVYAKCERVGTGATILFSTTKITADSDVNYYHFLLGMLNSVDVNNTRALALTYGFTTVNGRFIKTGRIQSADGNTYFDLDAGEFKGNFKFTSGTSVETAVTGAQSTANTAVTNAASAQTTANNAATAAGNAATAASNAQTAANTANTEISNISSDNILSISEKSGERNRWNIISAEKSAINTQATAFAITTENTAYNTAFQALATYLNAGTTWASGIPSWISDANLGTNTIIAGATYRTTWETFYAARQTLLNAIYAKAKTLADTAQTQANTATTNAATAQTAANNAASAAATAQTAANNAQTAANTANNSISDIASDNKLTAIEKQQTKLEWDSIVSEKTKNDTQADTFLVTKTYYGIAYNSLSAYITPLLSSLSVTSDIVGTDFRSVFKNYYDSRTDLLNSISAKAKTLADTAQSTVDNIQVGGRNIFKDSNYISKTAGTSISLTTWGGNVGTAGYDTDIPAGLIGVCEKRVTTVAGTGGNYHDNDSFYLIEGETYTMSYWAKANSTISLTNYFVCLSRTDGAYITPITPIVTAYWKRYFATFTVPVGYGGTWSRRSIVYIAEIFYISHFKLEKGNKATDWTPAPEDVPSAVQYLASAMGANTSIEGGLLSTSLIQVKDVNGNVTGGLSGLASDNVVMFGGGTYADAIQSATTPSAVAVIDRKDGSGHRAMGNLLWDKLGNLTVGLFKIVSGAITGYEGLYERIRITTNSMTPLATLVAGGWLREAKDYKYTSRYAGTLYNGYSDTPLVNVAYVSESAVLSIPVATSIKIYSGGALSYTLPTPSGMTFQSIIQKFTISGVGSYTLAAGANQTIVLAAGSYTISYAVEATFSITRYSSSVINISNASTAYVEVQSVAPSRTEIGGDGFFSFWSTIQYLYFDKINGLQVKGTTNIPGVLATGSIGSAGAHTNRWGAKSSTSNATYTATGIYDVIHTVGNTTYTILLTPSVDGNRASIISKSANSFRVQVRNSGNTVVAGAFDYTILGSNT